MARKLCITQGYGSGWSAPGSGSDPSEKPDPNHEKKTRTWPDKTPNFYNLTYNFCDLTWRAGGIFLSWPDPDPTFFENKDLQPFA